MAAFTEIEGDFLRITAGLGGGGPRGVRARPLACGLVHAAAVIPWRVQVMPGAEYPVGRLTG